VEPPRPKNVQPLDEQPEDARSKPRDGRSGGRTVFSLSEEETEQLGASLARGLRGGELVLLSGELGLGKTVFARGVATGLGIAREDVNSPSFTLVQEYRGGRLTMHHVDLYRLAEGDDLESLGLDDILGGSGVTVVEWGERLPPYYRRDAVSVRLYEMGEGCRRIEIDPAPTAPPKRVGDA